MSPNSYLFSFDRLVIYDEELSIAIDEPCQMDSGSQDLISLVAGGSVQESYNSRKERLLHTVKGGVYHGRAELLTDSGSLLWRGYYFNGRLHGPSRYFLAGRLLSITWFCHGKEYGKAFQYTANGALFAQLQFSCGLKHGLQLHYFASGSLRSVMHYCMGKLHGCVTLYYDGGKIKRITEYNDGMRHGKDIVYSLEGGILDEGCYEDGKAIGLHKRYYLSGMLREKSTYHQGERISWAYWDEQGTAIDGGGPFV